MFCSCIEFFHFLSFLYDKTGFQQPNYQPTLTSPFLRAQHFLSSNNYQTIMEKFNPASYHGMSSLAVLVTVLSLAFGFLVVLRNWGNARGCHLPPGPRGLPILGYLPFLKEHLHRQFAELAKVYGPIYKIWLGNKLWVVISSPSLAKEISRDQDVCFANRDVTIAAYIFSSGRNDVAFAKHGPGLTKMRKMLREMMSNSSLDACYSLRRDEVRKCVGSLYSKAGSPVDIGQVALLVLVNSIMAMLWGHTVKRDESEMVGLEFQKTAEKMMVLFGKANISDLFPALARFDLQGVESQAKSCQLHLDTILYSIIDRANEAKAIQNTKKERELGNNQKRRDLLQLILDLEAAIEGDDKSPASPARSREIKAILQNVFVAATDTTSTMMEWAMARLLHHKAVGKKVTDELTAVVGIDNSVEECHLPKLTYLDAVIKETLRLHPALPLLLARTPKQTATVSGYTIPKGTKVFVNVWTIQRDPQLWENPLQFKPERFLDNPDLDFSGNNFRYLPFGSGRRICPGIPLAEKMLKYVVATLWHSFEWELPQGTELEFSDQFGILVRKMKPLIAIPKPRLPKPDLYH